MHIGKRHGAGRPTVPPHLKKRLISIRLPEWMLQWMDEQPDTNRAVLIEDALKKSHNIEPPNDRQ